MTDLPRIYFDGNEKTPGPNGIPGLWLPKSISDLAAIPGGPHEGMRVVIYTDDVEMEALLRLERASGDWLAEPIAGTWKAVHFSDF